MSTRSTVVRAIASGAGTLGQASALPLRLRDDGRQSAYDRAVWMLVFRVGR